jgi:hypothetical protein
MIIINKKKNIVKNNYVQNSSGWYEGILIQEGHDGPEIAHLYIGPLAGPILTQGLLFEQTW